MAGEEAFDAMSVDKRAERGVNQGVNQASGAGEAGPRLGFLLARRGLVRDAGGRSHRIGCADEWRVLRAAGQGAHQPLALVRRLLLDCLGVPAAATLAEVGLQWSAVSAFLQAQAEGAQCQAALREAIEALAALAQREEPAALTAQGAQMLAVRTALQQLLRGLPGRSARAAVLLQIDGAERCDAASLDLLTELTQSADLGLLLIGARGAAWGAPVRRWLRQEPLVVAIDFSLCPAELGSLCCSERPR